ncbi:MAG: protein phosphatase CheZ [Rhodothermales bacterium]
MSTKHMSTILDKLDELRALFVLGQRAIPLLEEMFHFVKDISTLFDEINASIRDSAKRMPDATSKLVSVSQATEMATTEILDLVDGALFNLGRVKQLIEQSNTQIDQIRWADAHLIRLLRSGLRGKDDQLLAKIERIHEQKKAIRRGLSSQVRTDIEAVDELRRNLNHIMIALQVQDITAQQLAAVNHLIESIRDRMGGLINRLGSDGFDFEDITVHGRFAAFDPNATYDRTGERQLAADEVMASYDGDGSASPEPSGPTSQDEIDRLFGGGSSPATDVSVCEVAPDPEPKEKQGTVASQDSIDDLFNTQSGGVASQEDIDKLFQNGF